jgi:hypothetical protein
MDPQLEGVLALQDLDMMIAELTDPGTSRQMSGLGFTVEPLERLHAARAQAASRLSRDVRTLYERLARRYERRVVPVQDNICLGCFVAQPTYLTGAGNSKLHRCEFCGRILYW